MDIVIEFMRGTEGLLTGLAFLIIAVVAMMKELREWLRILEGWFDKHVRGRPPTKPGGTSKISPGQSNSTSRRKIATVILLLAFTIAIFIVQVAYPLPLNVRLTNKAWRAYNKGDYRGAIAYAEQCIDEFKMTANSQQSDLTKHSVAKPPTGEVQNTDVKREIFSRGPLNDVATCYWIKGRSAEKLGDVDEARDAYKAAIEYPHARCWDSRGWFLRGLFWSPSDDSEGRLENLKQ